MAADVAAASLEKNRPTLLPEGCHDADDDELAGDAYDAPVSPIDLQRARIRWALPVAVMLCIVCAGLAGWLGFRAWKVDQQSTVHAQWVQVARQGALNLTTIDHSRVDADIQRILDSSTGRFREDFKNRSQPFVDVVKQAQSKSEGEITEAALESTSGDSALVLVSVSVKTWALGTQQDTKSWRMRIQVQNTGDGAKVANVEFVP